MPVAVVVAVPVLVPVPFLVSVPIAVVVAVRAVAVVVAGLVYPAVLVLVTGLVMVMVMAGVLARGMVTAVVVVIMVWMVVIVGHERDRPTWTAQAPLLAGRDGQCDCDDAGARSRQWCARVVGMRVASIHTYPIKGCHRLDQERAAVQPWGLFGDRRWLIVDPDDGKAITQRDTTRLTQIRPALVDGGLVLRTDGLGDLIVDEPTGDDLMEVTVWQFTGPAAVVSTTADDWLTEALSRKVRLVFLDDPTRRPVEPGYARPDDRVSFADGYPVLLANTASLADLNDRIAESGSLEGPLPMTRFRPNIVISGAPAWIEDGWTGGRIRIGAVEFRVPKRCGRCVVTTTDQETGDRGREPLRTLAQFRNVDQSLLFAANLIPDGPGHIAVGDPVIPG